MATLSSFKNEDALDLMAEIIDPISEISKDAEFRKAALASGNKIKAVQIALKNHKSAIIQVLAALDRTPVEEYQGTVLTMTKSLLEILNDKEFQEAFQLQGQTEDENASGSATENTEDSAN